MFHWCCNKLAGTPRVLPCFAVSIQLSGRWGRAGSTQPLKVSSVAPELCKCSTWSSAWAGVQLRLGWLNFLHWLRMLGSRHQYINKREKWGLFGPCFPYHGLKNTSPWVCGNGLCGCLCIWVEKISRKQEAEKGQVHTKGVMFNTPKRW